MSVFRKFKFPQLLRKGPPASEIGEDIPRFKCSELPLKQRLGQGSFGDVYTAEYRASGDTKCHTVVVKKMLQVLDQEEKKLFCKEVMHQSIPAVPIPPPGISREFAHVLIPRVGHLKFYHCPGVGHLPTPGTTPGHLTR